MGIGVSPFFCSSSFSQDLRKASDVKKRTFMEYNVKGFSGRSMRFNVKSWLIYEEIVIHIVIYCFKTQILRGYRFSHESHSLIYLSKVWVTQICPLGWIFHIWIWTKLTQSIDYYQHFKKISIVKFSIKPRKFSIFSIQINLNVGAPGRKKETCST